MAMQMFQCLAFMKGQAKTIQTDEDAGSKSEPKRN